MSTSGSSWKGGGQVDKFEQAYITKRAESFHCYLNPQGGRYEES